MERTDLQRLSKDELIELVLQLQRPLKNSRTSSMPPSTDRKERRENSKPGGAKPGHPGHSRKLCDQPDELRDHVPDVCPGCGAAFCGDEARSLTGECDSIDLPPITPYVVRHRQFSCRCGACGLLVKADLPPEAHGTPFGRNIHAMALYLKGFQALSYERLARLFSDLFGLSVSQGALMNMFKRTRGRFQAQARKAQALLRQAKVVASDETGMRIEGGNSYQWVFVCDEAVVHTADFTRAASVAHTMMDGHQPQVWLSDRYSAQQKHGVRHQTCLAHLARDAAFADEHGADSVPSRLKRWFGQVFDLAKNITQFARSTILSKQRRLEKALDSILSAPSTCALAKELQGKISRARHQLLTFCDFNGEVEPTNNACERALRPCVIQRKVTNGYRAMWAAQAEAALRTTVDTARLSGKRPYQTILVTLA